nr:hypothetical protein [Tanacetum cinerariifolium]
MGRYRRSGDKKRVNTHRYAVAFSNPRDIWDIFYLFPNKLASNVDTLVVHADQSRPIRRPGFFPRPALHYLFSRYADAFTVSKLTGVHRLPEWQKETALILTQQCGGVDTMPNDYSLSDVLERIYHNQLALEAALMELTLWVEQRGSEDVGANVRGALETIGENAGHIAQDEARPGELENTEIYFAPPDQLNDPLEGYLEIFWSGDIIVWKNLFKHYLFCLTHRALDLYIFGEKPTLNKTVTIPDSLSGANEEGRKLLDSVYELFFSNHLMAEYIECLTTRQIYRDELSAHLFSLHQNMLYCVYRAFEANNMPWPGLSFLTNFEKDRESFFKNTAIPFLKDRAKQAHRVEDDVFTRTVFNTNQMWLQKQYQAAENKKKVSGNMDFLLVGFPSAFLQALETLTYPN